MASTARVQVGAAPEVRRRQFVAFQDPAVLVAVIDVCRLLGHFCDISLLADHFLTVFRLGGARQKQAGLALAELLRGASGVKVPTTSGQTKASDLDLTGGADVGPAGTSSSQPTQAAPALQQSGVNRVSACVAVGHTVLEEFLSAELWRLPTCQEEAGPGVGTVTSDSAGALCSTAVSVSAATLIHNAQLQTVLLDGIGAVAEAVGSQFAHWLVICMYPLLEKLGSATAIVAHSALVALDRVRLAVGEDSLSDLVCSSSDYLINTITINLRYLDLNQNTPVVLNTMLRCCDSRLLPLVSDSLEEVFGILDSCDDQRTETILSVLHALVTSMRRWQGAVTPTATSTDDADDGHSRSSSSPAFPSPAATTTSSATDQPSAPRFAQPRPALSTTTELSIAKSIVERCPHFAGHASMRCRMLSLEVIGGAAALLAADEDELLPAVHTVWPTLVARLADPNAAVQLVAMQVVAEVAALAGTFTTRRVTENVVPLLCKLLRSEHAQSEANTKLGRFARVYKLEQGALTALCRLVQALNLGAHPVGATVCTAAAVYLDASQPEELQAHAKELITLLAESDPDAVWLLLLRLHCSTPLEPPPGAGFRKPRVAPHREAFAANVEQLLRGLGSR